MKSILYTDEIHINKYKNDDQMIYIEPNLSKDIKSIKIKFKNHETEFESIINKMELLPCLFSIIGNDNLWSKINHHIKNSSVHPDTDVYLKQLKSNMSDGFLYGFISYISFFSLIENSHFRKLLPIQFQIPARLEDGDCCQYYVLQYMYQPLNSMLQLFEEDYFLYHYFNIIIGFINIWSFAFQKGAPINENIVNHLNADIMTGVTKYYIHHFKKIKSSLSEYECTLKDSSNISSTYSNTNDLIYNNASNLCDSVSDTSKDVICNTSSNTNSNTSSNNTSKSSNTLENSLIYYEASLPVHTKKQIVKESNISDISNVNNDINDNENDEYKDDDKYEYIDKDQFKSIIQKKVNKKIDKIMHHIMNEVEYKIEQLVNEKMTEYINQQKPVYQYVPNVSNVPNYNAMYEQPNEKLVLNLTTGLKY